MAEGRFAGKSVLVTGAADGIGLAAAQRFASEGAQVLAVDIAGDKLHAAVDGYTGITAYQQDVAAPDAGQALAVQVEARFEALDILVNNAGMLSLGALAEADLAAWQQTFDINVRSIYQISGCMLPFLQRSSGGRVVNTASLSAVISNPGMGIYTASKHAVAGLSKVMAQEWGEFGITVNYVLPGAIVTGITRDALAADADFKAFWERKSPLGRLGQPDDIAGAIAFLASEDAAFITGHGLVVDGGALTTA